jgi:protein gp37
MSENGPIWTGKIRLIEEALSEPARWRKSARVFVNSMSDLFHEDVPQAFLARVFQVMREAPQHTFQILTKRAARMAVILSALHDDGREPGSNVWCGVSVENQEQADLRIPLLLDTPAAVRFLSVEPLLAPVSLRFHKICGKQCFTVANPSGHLDALDWVIVGGESGPNARPCNIEWIRDIVSQCKAAAVPVFVKQLGASCYSTNKADQTAKPIRVDLRDFKGGDISEWPKDLQVREFPVVRHRSAPMDTASRRHG